MSLILVFSKMAFVCTFGINIAIFSYRHTNRCEKRSIFQFFALLHTEYDDNIANAFFSSSLSHSPNLSWLLYTAGTFPISIDLFGGKPFVCTSLERFIVRYGHRQNDMFVHFRKNQFTNII